MTKRIIIFLLLLHGLQMQAYPASLSNILPDSSLKHQASELILSHEDGRIIVEPDIWNLYRFLFRNNILQEGADNIMEIPGYLLKGNVIKVVAEDVSGNQKTDSIAICPAENVNAFSPNGDGYNDVFLKGHESTVFDRWGKELYNGKDGWDGNYNGNKVAAGTYFYIRHVRDNSGNIVNEHKGTVTLIRQ